MGKGPCQGIGQLLGREYPLHRQQPFSCESKKVTGSQDDGFVGDLGTQLVGLQKHEKIEKVTGSPTARRGRRDDKKERVVVRRGRLPTERVVAIAGDLRQHATLYRKIVVLEEATVSCVSSRPGKYSRLTQNRF